MNTFNLKLFNFLHCRSGLRLVLIIQYEFWDFSDIFYVSFKETAQWFKVFAVTCGDKKKKKEKNSEAAGRKLAYKEVMFFIRL